MENQTAQTSVMVDGDKLAEAIRRVTPFLAEATRPNLACVYAESKGGVLQLTATDGYRMAHSTMALPFPEGDWLLKGAGCKDFSTRHYNGAEVEVKVNDALPDGSLQMGDVTVELETPPYVNYPDLIPEDLDTEAIIDTKAWIKVIRTNKPEIIGVAFSQAGCRMYLQGKGGETTACESLPVQMFSGPDKKVAYNAEYFRRALTSCGPTATILVADPDKATLFETDDYWHLLIPSQVFPREVGMTNTEREAIKWAEEALDAIRKGEVPGIVLIGGGKFYLELRPGLVTTQVEVREPKLAEEVAEPESGTISHNSQ